MLDSTGVAVANEPSFAEVAEALSLGLPYRVSVGPDGKGVRFLHLGATCHDVIGVPAEAVLADVDAFIGLVAPADRPRLVAEFEAARTERRTSLIEVQMRGPDGEPRWRRMTAAPRWFDDGASEWDGLVTDITESRRLAEQLAEERRRLELAIELSGMGVFQWVREAPRSVSWSDRQYDIYGLPRGAPVEIGQLLAMVHPEDMALVAAASRNALGRPGDSDFSTEYRIMRPDGQVRWVLQHQRIDRSVPGRTLVHGTTLDVTERRNAEEQRRLQMREMAHRGKNALAVLMAMVNQAARDAATADDLAEVLMSRIGAMARSQELATAWDGRPLPMATLVRQALEPFDLSRFDLDPELEAITTPGEGVIGMALLLHELATNAVKYGALSNQDGRVSLARGDESDGRAVVAWREVGGPPVAAPGRHGFGARLIAAVLQRIGGRVSPDYASDGFVARIEIPLV